MGGITYLEAVRALAERVAEDWPSVRADLEILRGLVLNRPGLVLNLTADAGLLARAERRLPLWRSPCPAPFPFP